MIDPITIVTTVLAGSFGVSTFLQARENEKLKERYEKHDDEIEGFKRSERYLTKTMESMSIELSEVNKLNNIHKRDADRYYKMYSEKCTKNNELVSQSREADKKIAYMKDMIEANQNLVQSNVSGFYQTEKLTPLVYQTTIKGNEVFRPDEEAEAKIRKEIGQAIASMLKIKIIESRDHDGLRKDSQIKIILKQLDYEI